MLQILDLHRCLGWKGHFWKQNQIQHIPTPQKVKMSQISDSDKPSAPKATVPSTLTARAARMDSSNPCKPVPAHSLARGTSLTPHRKANEAQHQLVAVLLPRKVHRENNCWKPLDTEIFNESS